jgi:hypothetical protein
MRSINLLLLVLSLACLAKAQVATGGDFTIEKSVVAGGGGEGSGGAFDAKTTTGQAAAGGPKTGPPFSIYSGFWTHGTAQTPTEPCPLGQGYWKNTSGAWPVSTLVLGDEAYAKAELLSVLNMPPGNGKATDASLILGYQVIAAKLNVANGVDPAPLGPAISDADALLALYNGKLPYKVMSSTSIGQSMVSIGLLLESFNKGLFTPGCSPAPAL